MIRNLYSIKDSKSNTFGTLLAQHNDASAIRLFDIIVNLGSEDSTQSKYPGDFDLFYLGTMDEVTGNLMSNASGPVHLINGRTLRDQHLAREKRD